MSLRRASPAVNVLGRALGGLQVGNTPGTANLNGPVAPLAPLALAQPQVHVQITSAPMFVGHQGPPGGPFAVPLSATATSAAGQPQAPGPIPGLNVNMGQIQQMMQTIGPMVQPFVQQISAQMQQQQQGASAASASTPAAGTSSSGAAPVNPFAALMQQIGQGQGAQGAQAQTISQGQAGAGAQPNPLAGMMQMLMRGAAGQTQAQPQPAPTSSPSPSASTASVPSTPSAPIPVAYPAASQPAAGAGGAPNIMNLFMQMMGNVLASSSTLCNRFVCC